MKRVLLGLVCFFSMVQFAFGYSATVNMKQQYDELVAGWYIDAGPTKGGPYPNITDCIKPTKKADGSFDCAIAGYTANPAYFVVTPYNSSKVKIANATSAEQVINVAVPPPTDIKVVVTIVTVSRVTRYGNAIASTTVERTEVPLSKVVKEGTVNYRKADGTWYTKTTLVIGS